MRYRRLSKAMNKNDFDLIEFRPKSTKYCIGIPVINEGDKFKKQLVKMSRFSDLADTIIFDGGSTDGSMDKNFLKKNGVRSLLTLKRGKGQGTQLRMGLSYCLKENYKGVVTIDGNGKDNPNAIPNFLRELDKGYDLILGSRFIKGGKALNTPLVRLLAIRLIHAPILSMAAGKWYTDTTNGFRAYSKNYLLNPKVNPFREIFKKYELYLYLTVRASQIGFKTEETPVARIYPKGNVPTKIKGVRSNLSLLLATIKVALGEYEP